MVQLSRDMTNSVGIWPTQSGFDQLSQQHWGGLPPPPPLWRHPWCMASITLALGRRWWEGALHPCHGPWGIQGIQRQLNCLHLQDNRCGVPSLERTISPLRSNPADVLPNQSVTCWWRREMEEALGQGPQRPTSPPAVTIWCIANFILKKGQALLSCLLRLSSGTSAATWENTCWPCL